MSEIPTFVKKKYQGSSRKFRRKPVRRSLHRPKLGPKVILESHLVAKDLTQLARLPKVAISESRSPPNTEKSDMPESERQVGANPFKRESKAQSKAQSKAGESELMPRSILPSESYTRMVKVATSQNFSGLPVSPRPRNKSAKILLSDSKMADLRKSRSKRPKRYRSTEKNKQSEEAQEELLKKRTELQAKYRKQNSMSHTPDVRSLVKSSPKKVKRSSTPQPKSSSQLMQSPFIRVPPRNRKFTLVLDLDETLIHFKNIPGKAKFLIRPHCYKFLRNLHSHFELIIFTAAQQQYADWIINKIDQKVGAGLTEEMHFVSLLQETLHHVSHGTCQGPVPNRAKLEHDSHCGQLQREFPKSEGKRDPHSELVWEFGRSSAGFTGGHFDANGLRRPCRCANLHI